MSACHRIERVQCEAVAWRLGPVGQVPVGEGRAFVVGNEQVAVFRLREGGMRAVAAVCPHRGGPLADGLIDGQQVICPLHNHAFRLIDGQCTTGESPVRAYRVSVDNGELVVHL
ncbi:MAG TPA: Rieske (2Fe-2S) protein [Pseudonocardiaceae bacterium]|jgi:NAD(P)H-dependent nitrite reductase small subunit|nr:Rieske (2Fe-2S) protein [Pseudonocardiaceae bacterium]